MASDQRAVAVAQSDIMTYLESKGYDAGTVEGMSQAEMVHLAQVNVESDKRAAGPAALGEFDGSDLGGLGEVGYSLENPELREHIVADILDQITDRMSDKDKAALGIPYGFEGLEPYVQTDVFKREPGLTNEEYDAAFKEEELRLMQLNQRQGLGALMPGLDP